MEDYTFLLSLAIILLSTKLFGLASERIHLPQVVGALLAGIVLGPSGFGILESNEFLTYTAEIGVIMLMFTAGIDTDLRELKETGLAATAVAVLGVVLPLLLCGGVYFWFFEDSFTYEAALKAGFFGIIFSATSVSITVETLNEMGKLKGKMGSILLSAAIIDDIIGIILLSVFTGLSGGDSSIVWVLVRIALFFVFTFVASLVVHKIFWMIAEGHWHSRRIAIWAFAFCLLMSYCAEEIFGVADITGAFFAGLILCNISKAREFVAKKFTVTSYMFFAPVFFASIGMSTNMRDITSEVIVFALVLLVAAIISKVVGCGMAARMFGMNRHESLAIGAGMMARGEVALMVAQKGVAAGMVSQSLLPTIILSVIVVSLVTPVALRSIFAKEPTVHTDAMPEPRGC